MGEPNCRPESTNVGLTRAARLATRCSAIAEISQSQQDSRKYLADNIRPNTTPRMVHDHPPFGGVNRIGRPMERPQPGRRTASKPPGHSQTDQTGRLRCSQRALASAVEIGSPPPPRITGNGRSQFRARDAGVGVGEGT